MTDQTSGRAPFDWYLTKLKSAPQPDKMSAEGWEAAKDAVAGFLDRMQQGDNFTGYLSQYEAAYYVTFPHSRLLKINETKDFLKLVWDTLIPLTSAPMRDTPLLTSSTKDKTVPPRGHMLGLLKAAAWHSMGMFPAGGLNAAGASEAWPVYFHSIKVNEAMSDTFKKTGTEAARRDRRKSHRPITGPAKTTAQPTPVLGGGKSK